MASLNTENGIPLPKSHQNSSLAPSQEMAYRQKCIDLKRRLSEIEANNDSIRQRLARERRFQDKMRLNRAILLNHMKELVESPSKSYGQGKTGRKSAILHSTILPAQDEQGDGFMLYDSSEMSSNEEIKEVSEQPPPGNTHGLEQANHITHVSQSEERHVRIKRARDGTPRTSVILPNNIDAHNTPLTTNVAALPSYHSSGLPHIAPANDYSPAASTQALEPHTSSFRIASSVSNATLTPLQPHPAAHQVSNNSPTSLHQTPAPALPPAMPLDRSMPPLPVRPGPPFDQFTAHLIPQLQADNVPAADIEPKIRDTWIGIGEAGQEPWKRKYGEEMMTYERAMDEWKRAQREGSRGTKFVNGGGGGFSAVNR